MGNGNLAGAIRSGFHGKLIAPGDGGYDEARKVWNGMIDKRPALIAQCETTSDVVAVVGLARDKGLPLAVRGGAHNVAGNAVCDDGVVIDLRSMKRCDVDVEARIARAEGGLTWHEYDAATQKHGLASPGGAISSTGIAGLTLGGGFGWLSRSYGLVCDHVVSAEVVTAGGDVLTVSADENSDLYWAIRGGGGNFGVVTRFDYRLHEVGELYAGLILYPRSEAHAFLRMFADLTASAPDELSTMAAMLCAPDGTPVVGQFSVYHGPAEEGEKVLDPVRSLGTPIVDDVAMKPYTIVQQAFDDGFPSGNRNYWKANYITKVDHACIDVLVEHANAAPSPMCVVGLEHMMGGAVSRIPAEDTAFGHREAEYNLLILGMHDDPGLDDAVRDWARGYSAAVQPFSTGGVYVNYMTDDEPDRIGAAYGSKHYERLASIKKKYDPDNLFRLNQNIVPVS